MTKRAWIWLSLVILIEVGGMFLSSGDISIYGDLLSFLMIPVLPILLTGLAYSFKGLLRSFHIISAGVSATSKELYKTRSMFRTLQNMTILSAGIATVVSLVAIFRSIAGILEKHRMTVMGQGLGVIFLVTLYALLFCAIVTQPGIRAAEKKIIDQGGEV